MLTDFPPGVSGNPGGFPKGFLPLSKAYAIVSKLELSEIEEVASGKKPKGWGKRPLLIAYVTAARMWLGATSVSAAAEIADRTEGKVKGTLELQVSSLAGLVAALAKGPSR
ncbi:MAG: hypothetical protein WC969_14995 [Elusimicrobiota bacterium]|jgi:hypothetical protein